MEYYTLRDGLVLPKIGFGTYKLNGASGVYSILTAINNGYRLLDSAFNYENEGVLGQAIKKSSVNRSDLLVTSKLPGRHYKYQEAIDTIKESLYRSDLDYFDIYLLHWPNPKQDQYVEAWQALIQAQKFGLIHSIGACNFLPEHLDRLSRETGVLPTINQVELHPYFNQEKQRKYNNDHNILTEDWSPLGRASDILHDPLLLNLANKYQKNVGQIILRWQIQINTLPIPKSTKAGRQKNNIDLFDFEISEDDIAKINSLTKPNGRTANQDPAVYEEF